MQSQVEKLRQDMAEREDEHRQKVERLVNLAERVMMREVRLSKALETREKEIEELKCSKQSSML